jgi:DNA-binding transcriptional regulator LsrR (DeoR family)
MKLHEFKTLLQLTRIKPDSQASKGAALVLVNGLTQTAAAQVLGCQQTTISRAVRTLRDRQRIARQVI